MVVRISTHTCYRSLCLTTLQGACTELLLPLVDIFCTPFKLAGNALASACIHHLADDGLVTCMLVLGTRFSLQTCHSWGIRHCSFRAQIEGLVGRQKCQEEEQSADWAHRGLRFGTSLDVGCKTSLERTRL